jgi:hypothetical protein
MAEVEDELGMGSDGDGDFAREILGSIEGDKAIDTDIVIPSSGCKALLCRAIAWRVSRSMRLDRRLRETARLRLMA